MMAMMVTMAMVVRMAMPTTMMMRPGVYIGNHTLHVLQGQVREVAPEVLFQSGMTSPGNHDDHAWNVDDVDCEVAPEMILALILILGVPKNCALGFLYPTYASNTSIK